MKECNRCVNLGIDSVPDEEYGEIIWPTCYSGNHDVSNKKDKCKNYEEADDRYYEHELWDEFYGME